MPNNIITHAVNKTHHPGTPDLPAPRRSSQMIREECIAQHAAHATARLQQRENIHQVAEIEDQLQMQMKMQRTNFQNPTSVIDRSLRPQPMSETVADGATSMAPALNHVQGHDEGDGDSQGTETEKGKYTNAPNVREFTFLISFRRCA
jgi:hypothetical protein